MKQSLQLKLSQQLTLTPQLQQAIRLLQLSTLEFNQEINQMLQENPMLERIEGTEAGEGEGAEMPMPSLAPPSSADSSNSDSPAGETRSDERVDDHSNDYDSSEAVYDELAWGDRAVAPSRDDEDEDRGFQSADQAGIGLRQHLAEQLSLMPLTLRDRQLLAMLVESLNDDGYVTVTLDDLMEMLPEELEIEPEELQTVLRLLQSLDPAGVGARDLSECLALQLEALPLSTPYRNEALSLVHEYLPLLADRDFRKLKKVLGVDSDQALSAIRNLVTSLDPRPGGRFAQTETHYVAPDVIVRKQRGGWVVTLNAEAMPKLRVNELYANILRQNKEGGSGLQAQLQEARWMVKNVHQRFQTILRVGQAIVERQRLFLEHGDVGMRPLILREIADELGLHESTISRVTNQKYMMTPRGLYEFKYFFGSALATDAGGAASSTAIKALIRQFVEAENRLKPLSDQLISEMLGQQGYVVARRTVAKYREQMNIYPANQRKSI